MQDLKNHEARFKNITIIKKKPFSETNKRIIFKKRPIIIIIILEIRQLYEDALTRKRMMSAKYVTYSTVPSFNYYLEFQFLLTL